MGKRAFLALGVVAITATIFGVLTRSEPKESPFSAEFSHKKMIESSHNIFEKYTSICLVGRSAYDFLNSATKAVCAPSENSMILGVNILSKTCEPISFSGLEVQFLYEYEAECRNTDTDFKLIRIQRTKYELDSIIFEK